MTLNISEVEFFMARLFNKTLILSTQLSIQLIYYFSIVEKVNEPVMNLLLMLNLSLVFAFSIWSLSTILSVEIPVITKILELVKNGTLSINQNFIFCSIYIWLLTLNIQTVGNLL